jgi:hypothetical protein
MKTTLLLGCLLASVGCGKSETESGPGASKKVASTSSTKLEYTRLGDLELEAEIPSGSIDSNRKNRADTIGIESSPKLMVAGQRDMEWKDSVAAVKSDIEKRATSFGEFTRADAKDDGTFHLEYTFKPGDEMSHGFVVRKKIGDKLYDCGTKPWSKDTVTKEQLVKVIKICESLRATK